MSSTGQPPPEPFRVSQLLYDTRYRSYTIQIFALAVIMLAFAWAIDNAVRNLEALGKDIDFGFIFETSAYDINQHLLDYDSTSTHGRAALIGIINTILVAVMGCVTATVIGVLAGVLRLSRNWVVARLMTVYIETVRNIPVLIWILFTVAIVNEVLPGVRSFRGEDALSGLLFDSVFITNRGFYIPAPVFEAGSAAVGAVLLLSIAAAWYFGRWARARQAATGQILPVFWGRLAILAVPVPACVLRRGLAGLAGDSRPQGFQLQGRNLHARQPDRPVAGALGLYRRLHRRDRARRHPRDQQGPDGGGLCARPQARAHHEPRRAAPGAPRHRAAAHQPVPPTSPRTPRSPLRWDTWTPRARSAASR